MMVWAFAAVALTVAAVGATLRHMSRSRRSSHRSHDTAPGPVLQPRPGHLRRSTTRRPAAVGVASAKPPAHQPPVCGDSPTTPAAGAAPPRPPEPAQPRTVLLIDDEEAVREVVQLILEQRGVRVLTADDGPSGVALVRAHAPLIDAVLLDMTLPTMTGAAVSAALRAIRPDVRIIVATGHDPRHALAAVPRAGFVAKPFSPADLLAALATAAE